MRSHSVLLIVLHISKLPVLNQVSFWYSEILEKTIHSVKWAYDIHSAFNSLSLCLSSVFDNVTSKMDTSNDKDIIYIIVCQILKVPSDK